MLTSLDILYMAAVNNWLLALGAPLMLAISCMLCYIKCHYYMWLLHNLYAFSLHLCHVKVGGLVLKNAAVYTTACVLDLRAQHLTLYGRFRV